MKLNAIRSMVRLVLNTCLIESQKYTGLIIFAFKIMTI